MSEIKLDQKVQQQQQTAEEFSQTSLGAISRLAVKAELHGALPNTGIANPPVVTFGSNPGVNSQINQQILKGDATFHAHQSRNGFSRQIEANEPIVSTEGQEAAKFNLSGIAKVFHTGNSPFEKKVSVRQANRDEVSLEGYIRLPQIGSGVSPQRHTIAEAKQYSAALAA